VTTTIARWDPEGDWPTDLRCALAWNASLASHDGVALSLGAVPARGALATAPLALSLGGIASELASELTGDNWSAYIGLPDDGLPEALDRSSLTLAFGSPVNFGLLQRALKPYVAAAAGYKPALLGLAVSRCEEEEEGAGTVVSSDGGGGGGRPPRGAPLPESAACAVVRLQSPLTPGAGYALALPAGTTYSPTAGPLAADLNVTFFGPRRFRLPLRPDWQRPRSAGEEVYAGVQHRALHAWLPHGLADGVAAPALAARVSLCRVARRFGGGDEEPCEEETFNLTLRGKSTARLEVPGLAPRGRYRLAVSASPRLKDGLGLPLEASASEFWATAAPNHFAAPALTTGGQVALVDAAAGALGLPLLTQGPPSSAGAVLEAWPVRSDSLEELEKALHYFVARGERYNYAPDYFGPAPLRAAAPRDEAPAVQALKLSEGGGGASSVHVAHTCCYAQDRRARARARASAGCLAAASPAAASCRLPPAPLLAPPLTAASPSLPPFFLRARDPAAPPPAAPPSPRCWCSAPGCRRRW
jgi:hypothetical protein